MLNQIFNPNNFLFRALGKALDVVLLGMLWLVCSLPIITAGAATTALYYSIVKCVRRGEEKPYANFFRCFKENFKVSVPISILAAVLWYLLSWGYGIVLVLASEQGGWMAAVHIGYSIALVVPLGVLCYAFPVLSRFTFGPLQLLSTAFKLSVAHLPTTVVLVMLLLEAVDLCMKYWLVLFLPLFICPGVVALLFSLFLERIFKPLTPQEEALPTADSEEEEEKPWYLR